MKVQVRKGIWETNSSSTHTLAFASQSDYDRWQNGELYYDYLNDKLVEKTEETEKTRAEFALKRCSHLYSYRYLSYSEFFDYGVLEYDTFEEDYTTPNGDKIIAFGFYGHD